MHKILCFLLTLSVYCGSVFGSSEDYLTLSWFSDSDDLCQLVEYDEGLTLQPSFSLWTKGTLSGCAVDFIPADGYTFYSDDEELLTKISLKVSLDTTSSPVSGTRVVIYEYDDQDGSSVSYTDTYAFTIAGDDLALDGSQFPYRTFMMDSFGNTIPNQVALCFPLLQ